MEKHEDPSSMCPADMRIFLEAVESSSIATIITSTEPKIIYVNPAWIELTGYTAKEAVGNNPRILQSGKTPPEMYKLMWQTILQNKKFHSDAIINRRKNGTEYNAELRVFPIAENGAVKFFVGHEIDITFRLRAERAKTEFISLASHQLQSPVTAFRLGLELLEDEKTLKAEERELVKKLSKTAAQMQETIGVMLRLSHIEEGTLSVDHKTLDLDALFQNLQEEFQSQLKEKSQHLELQCEGNLALISDATLLHEILANLLSNAIKYTPGEGRITLSAQQMNGSIQLRVQDNGYGIPADQQSRLFSKFFRATNVIEKIPNGTGLGLYLVHALTELLSGSITCVSEENKGTTFTITLPPDGTSAPKEE